MVMTPGLGISLSYAPFGIPATADEVQLESVRMRTALGELTVHAGRRDRADDTATILLHGGAGSWSTFGPLLEADELSSLPGERLVRNVVAPDLPGWGATPLPVGEFDIDAAARSIVEATRALGYERWRIVGHSLGGFLALHLAAMEPERTVSVAVVSPSSFGIVDAVRHPVRALRRLPAFAGMRAAMATLGLWEGGGRLLTRGLGNSGALRGLAAPLFRHPSLVDESVYIALGEEVRPHAFTRAADAVRDYDLTSWGRITAPVTAIRGDADVFLAPDDLPALLAVIPGARSVVLERTGHFAHVERPFAVLDSLLRLESEPFSSL
ncbi:alpha/beta fold hydrolase [Glaciibacter flavus]|uniref:alpha/beta fold hydrolase n=1 Tax=Orlajensenia flava TaxID=2565934 RepID=UPI003AFF8DC6